MPEVEADYAKGVVGKRRGALPGHRISNNGDSSRVEGGTEAAQETKSRSALGYGLSPPVQPRAVTKSPPRLMAPEQRKRKGQAHRGDKGYGYLSEDGSDRQAANSGSRIRSPIMSISRSSQCDIPLLTGPTALGQTTVLRPCALPLSSSSQVSFLNMYQPPSPACSLPIVDVSQLCSTSVVTSKSTHFGNLVVPFPNEDSIVRVIQELSTVLSLGNGDPIGKSDPIRNFSWPFTERCHSACTISAHGVPGLASKSLMYRNGHWKHRACRRDHVCFEKPCGFSTPTIQQRQKHTTERYNDGSAVYSEH